MRKIREGWSDLLEQDDCRKDESQANRGSGARELEHDPNIGHHGWAEEDAADEEGRDEGEAEGVVGERGGSGEQSGVEVEAKGEVEQREDQHDVHGVAYPDDDADGMGEGHTQISIKVWQDVIPRRVSEQKVPERGCAEVDGAAQEHRPSHHLLHLLVWRVHRSSQLVRNWMHCNNKINAIQHKICGLILHTFQKIHNEGAQDEVTRQ